MQRNGRDLPLAAGRGIWSLHRRKAGYENYAKPSVRASTAAYYKNYIDQHIVPRIGDIKLTALTTLQIQKFYNETKAHGRVQRYEKMDDLSLSNKTIRGLHTML